MSALGVATMAVYGGLALVAFAFGFMSRGYSRSGLSIGLAGLLALTAGTTWLVRSWPAATIEDVAGLKAEVAALKAQARKLEGERDRARARSETAETDKAAAVAAKTGVERDLASTKAQLETLRNSSSTVTTAQAPPAVPSGGVQNTASITCPEPVRVAATTGRSVQALMDGRTRTAFYGIEPLQEPELVAGHSGKWYVLRLKVDDAPFLFPDRKFLLPEPATAIEESLGLLVKEIIEPAARTAKRHRIFVRGGADRRRMAGVTDAPGVSEIEVLQQGANGTYVATPEQRRFAGQVSNDDLPSLRADWLRRKLIGMKSPAVAAQAVPILSDARGVYAGRTAEILMFVDW